MAGTRILLPGGTVGLKSGGESALKGAGGETCGCCGFLCTPFCDEPPGAPSNWALTLSGGALCADTPCWAGSGLWATNSFRVRSITSGDINGVFPLGFSGVAGSCRYVSPPESETAVINVDRYDDTFCGGSPTNFDLYLRWEFYLGSFTGNTMRLRLQLHTDSAFSNPVRIFDWGAAGATFTDCYDSYVFTGPTNCTSNSFIEDATATADPV